MMTNNAFYPNQRAQLLSAARELPHFLWDTVEFARYGSADEYAMEDLRFVHLRSFRLPSDNKEEQLASLEQAMKSAAELLDDSGFFGFRIREGTLSLFIGCPPRTVDGLLASLGGSLSGLDAQVCHRDALALPSLPVSCVIGGDYADGHFEWDPVFRSLRSRNCLICFLLKRIPPAAVLEQEELLHTFSASLHQATYGNGGKGDPGLNPEIRQAKDALDARLEALRDRSAGPMWHTVLLCCADGEAALRETASAVRASFRRDSEAVGSGRILHPIRLDQNPLWDDEWYLPISQPEDSFLSGLLPLYDNRLAQNVNAPLLGKLVPVGLDEHPGYYVTKSGRTASDYSEYDLQPHTAPEEFRITIGTVEETGVPESVDLRLLRQHGSVFGASGSGKTQTITRIAADLNQKNVRMLFLEPIKGEFSSTLADYGIDARIVSSGFNGIPLCFNPFIPQELTTIQDHLRSLGLAITAASDCEAPIPQALQMLLSHVYSKHGWKGTDVYFRGDRRSFPTFQELYDEIQPYFDQSGLYQGEVRTNVKSALTVRLNFVKDFPFLRGTDTLDAEELLSQNTVISFDGLTNTADKCFFGNLILMNLNEYVNTLDLTDELRHLILIDEAHNFFCRENPGGRITPLTELSRTLSNMLSQIRGYGVGILLADQRPSCLDSSAIANTGLKIVHALEDGADIEMLAACMGLNAHQKALFHALPPGSCIVSVRGTRNVVRCRITRAEKIASAKPACRFCPRRTDCIRSRVQEMLADRPVEYFAALLRSSIANPSLLAKHAEEILAECGAAEEDKRTRLCLLGEIIEAVPGMKYREYLTSQMTRML